MIWVILKGERCWFNSFFDDVLLYFYIYIMNN